MVVYDKKAEQNNYSDYDMENTGCQSTDDGKELHFQKFVEEILFLSSILLLSLCVLFIKFCEISF